MSKLERQLDLSSVVAISVSTMLGSGLFVLPGLVVAKTGPSVWLAYLFAGFCVLPAALSKSELATAMPTSGGTYVYIDRAFGPLAGTIAGIGLWLALLLKSAFALVGFGAYLYVFADLPLDVIALAALGLIVYINIRGVRHVGRIQMIVVCIAVVGLGVIAGFGFGKYDATRLQHLFPEGVTGFLGASAFVFVSYAGVTKIAAVAEEVKRPARNLPLGMLLSLGIAMLLYAVVTAVLVACVPSEQLATDLHPIYTLADTVGGHALGLGAAGLGVVTMMSMANGGVLAASRFPYAMSRDDLLPASLRYLHARHRTPVVAIVLSGAIIATAILLLDVERIAKLASAFKIMIFLAVNVAVIVFRETGAQWYKPSYRSPLYPAAQIFGILACALLLIMLGPMALVAGVAVGIPGLLIFVLYSRDRTERRGVVGIRGRRRELLRPITQEMPIVDVGSDKAAVLVPLFGTERSPELLVETGAALADGGLVRIAYIVEVPEQLSLDALKDEPLISSVKRRVEAMAETQRIPIAFESIISRDIVKTVYDLSTRTSCDWLFMDWRGRTRETFTFRNPLGWLKTHLHCKLAVFHDAGVRYIRKILVYAEPGPHDALVTRTADHMAKLHGADLTFMRFVRDDAPLTRAQAEADYLDQVRQLCDSPSDTLLVNGRDEARAIGRASAGFDLLVMAEPPATVVGMLRGRRDKITAGAACSVLRLQTPRAETHKALEQTRPAAATPKLSELLEQRCVVARLERMKKDAIFERIAQAFADRLPSIAATEVLAALQQRERTQNTAVGHGVALPHATVDTVDRTYLGVFTTAAPIDYQAPDGEGVDVLFATIGPPSDRQTHLYLLASVSRLVLQTSLLHELRKAGDSDAIVSAMQTRIGELDL